MLSYLLNEHLGYKGILGVSAVVDKLTTKEAITWWRNTEDAAGAGRAAPTSC
jgi:hypothetical protein